MEGGPRSSNHRASLAVLFGLVALLALPAAVALSQQSGTVTLLEASWAIPVAFGFGLLSFGWSNLARARVQWTLGRAGGLGRARAARLLGGAGISLALAAAIAVGFYEILLRFEK